MSDRNALYGIFGLVRILLWPLAVLYGGVVWLRNRLYDAGFFSSVEFSVPVICVGNLSVGGTGKTPHVEYLLRLLCGKYKLATMSRGYRRRTSGFLLADERTNALRIGDEPMQYHLGFPGVAVSVAEERMTGIPRLLQARPDTEVVILDDAYQHRSVKAGLNILITDFSRPYYTDYILPLGRLREGRKAVARAHCIVVSKCPPALSLNEAEKIRARVAPLLGQEVCFSSIRYGAAYDFFTREPRSLAGTHVVAVCGIANPAPLLAHLRSVCADVHALTYPDHHYFGSRNLEEMLAAVKAWDRPDTVIVTTEKDAARLHLHAETLAGWAVPMVVLPIEVQFLFDGEQSFDAAVLRYITAELGEPAHPEASPDAEDYGYTPPASE